MFNALATLGLASHLSLSGFMNNNPGHYISDSSLTSDERKALRAKRKTERQNRTKAQRLRRQQRA